MAEFITKPVIFNLAITSAWSDTNLRSLYSHTPALSPVISSQQVS